MDSLKLKAAKELQSLIGARDTCLTKLDMHVANAEVGWE
jgi:hypothetical protein